MYNWRINVNHVPWPHSANSLYDTLSDQFLQAGFTVSGGRQAVLGTFYFTASHRSVSAITLISLYPHSELWTAQLETDLV